jgi:L-amino acid N-acyltransferase YncA
VVSTPRILIRPARPADAAVVATIWNEGIAGREATFEVRPREPGEIAARLGDGLPFVVAELAGVVAGFGLLSAYSERPVYAGVGEASVYVTASARGRGIGTQLIEALVEQAEMRGMHKLLGKLFASNEASARLVRRCGFETVGVHRRHAQLDGEWRDVTLVELLIGPAR